MPNKKSIKKNYITKKNLIHAGVILSVAFNITILAAVGLAILQSSSGKLTSLSTNSPLLSTTCANYFNKQKTVVGPITNVSGINFYPLYLNDTSDNSCNRLLLSSQYAIKNLLETNNSNAINYYLNTTKLNKTQNSPQLEIPIYYNNKTKLPIDLTTQDFLAN